MKEASASETLFSMNSSVMRREGCSLNTEFISAILAALRRASALVGQNWGGGKRENGVKTPGILLLSLFGFFLGRFQTRLAQKGAAHQVL